MRKMLCIFLSFIVVIGGVFAIYYSYNYRYSQKIINAINDDDYNSFCQLIEEWGNIDSKPYLFDMDRINLPPLHYACLKGKHEYVIKLVESGANINNVNNSQKLSPLFLSLINKNENRLIIAKYLIDNGADIFVKNYQYTLLDYVFSANISTEYDQNKENDEYKFALFLIDKGLSITDSRLGNIIFNASINNNVLMTKHLIEINGKNINVVDSEYGNTPLIWATMFNSYHVAKYLVDNGADLDVKNIAGKTAKDIAIEKEYYEILDLL